MDGPVTRHGTAQEWPHEIPAPRERRSPDAAGPGRAQASSDGASRARGATPSVRRPMWPQEEIRLSRRTPRVRATVETDGGNNGGNMFHRPHCLNYLCAPSGLYVVTVSKALGHANAHITLVTYAHSIPRERQGAGDAFGRLMAQSGNKMETSTPEMASVA